MAINGYFKNLGSASLQHDGMHDTLYFGQNKLMKHFQLEEMKSSKTVEKRPQCREKKSVA